MSLKTWRVENVILVPHFAFPLSAIEKGKPLASTARRAGWVGCNILLGAIPSGRENSNRHGRKSKPGTRRPRARYERIRPLEKIETAQRGWTLDVLNVVRSLGKTEFQLSEVYAHAGRLERLHPNNQHVKDKIRQQLQVLRGYRCWSFLAAETPT